MPILAISGRQGKGPWKAKFHSGKWVERQRIILVHNPDEYSPVSIAARCEHEF